MKSCFSSSCRVAGRGLLAAVLFGCASVWAESFYLKSSKTGRMYGPFDYQDGAEVQLGDAKFEVMRSPEPGAATPTAKEQPAVAETETERNALAAVRPWLELVDSGDYAEAWRTAAPYLKIALTEEEFIKSLTAVRDTLGTVKSREMSSIQYTTTLPSAPDGEYVIIHFKATLERKKGAVETVVPMLQDDGHWRISGYYLR